MITLPDGRIPIPLSAHAADLVHQDAAAILAYLERRPQVTDVGAVASTVQRIRRLRRHRSVVRASDRTELTDALRSLAAGEEHRLVTTGNVGGPGRIAFVFPGQGSQWPSMGVEAYERLPLYRNEVDDCAAEFAAQGLASPLDYLLAAEGAETMDFSQVQIQGAQFVHGVALARVWRSCGVLPDITVGHSLGEIGAAYAAGAITRAVAVGVVGARATLLDTLTGPYRVAVLGVTPDHAREIIAATAGWVELSVVNSPTSVAISGETDAVAAAVRTVARRGAFAREIEMWFPAHTTALAPLRSELDALLPDGEFTETPVQFVGSATGGVVSAGTDFAQYWYHNLRSTVRFDRAVASALACGATTFVELSAHPALLFAVGDVLDAHPDPGPTVVVGSGRRDEPLTDRLSANVTTVALSDAGFRWEDAVGEPATVLPDFPFAPMRAEHLWAVAEPLPPITGITVGTPCWEPVAVAPAAGVHAAAVVDLGAADLASRLRDAFGAHDRVEEVAPGRADLLVVVAPAIADDDPVIAAARLADAVDAGLLTYAEGVTATTVWLVTVRAERVSQSDDSALPGQAALAAMHRSIGFEHPDRVFRHLDLPAGDFDAALAVDVLLGAEDVVLRAGTAHRRSLRDEQAAAPPWPREVFDDVVVTGGAGVVGRHFARALVERGARRIVLLSRHGVDDGAIAELAAGGDVEIVAPRCDVTDPGRLAAVAAEFARTGASLVVHAAGAATIGPAAGLTGSAVRESCAAKISGLAALTETWPLRSDARLLLCSSVSGLWGGSGHAAYAAANRLLDVAAERQRAAGRSCTSVRWGLWPGTGVIAAGEIERVERSGLTAMVPDRAVDVALRDHVGDPVVFAADARRLRVFLGTTEPPPPNEDRDADPAGIDAAGAVHAALGAVLKLADTAGLDVEAPLLDLGVDSLLAIDLRRKLKTATGQNVPLAVILGGVTTTGLIRRVKDSGNRALSRD